MAQQKSDANEMSLILERLHNMLVKEETISDKKSFVFTKLKKIENYMDEHEFDLDQEELVPMVEKKYPKLLFFVREMMRLTEKKGDEEDFLNVIKYYQFADKCLAFQTHKLPDYFELLVAFFAFEDCENDHLITETKSDLQYYFNRTGKSVDIFTKTQDNQFSELIDDLILFLLELDNENYDFLNSQAAYVLTRLEDMVSFLHNKEKAPELLDFDEVKRQLKQAYTRDFSILNILLEISIIQEFKQKHQTAVEICKKLKKIYDEKITRWLKEDFEDNRSIRFINFLDDKQKKNLTFTKRELKILFKYNFRYFLGHPTPEQMINITFGIASCVSNLKVLKPNAIFFSKTIYFLLENYKQKLVTAKELKDIYRFLASKYITLDSFDEKGADSSLKEILDFCMNSIFQGLN